ncbi:uncharacterized protein A1O9_06340 [Exophiala aquamarina CBS 119918]|uniref:Major facilitator superfamily (MFS) profile domain-containing protein n=1 Tax=Exophiala aquamarina CBS 119918 TaxID=1182545 RepID=A0A072PE96_9EURO|nr:uncharacterized protein A1O9_06340 [Exophiala aquamarina CBS 119918]KEF58414.1 hypothetical protein A1O9_06340 [Exophiala aquamarina CBS 119918]
MGNTNTVKEEKVNLSEIEGSEHNADIPDEQSDTEWASFDKKLDFKLDCLVVPLVTMVYLLAFLDRANIGNARVAGLQTDLRLTDHQYQIAITVTYIPYVLAEIPSNLVIKKIGPRFYIPALCFVWGVVSTLQCLIQGYPGLLACRFFLGLAEGGLFPGIILYLSNFYRRKQLSLRIAMFWSAASLSGAFSGLLAAAIGNMDGVGGLRGWRWIFCLEGIFTVLFAVLVFILLPNDPSHVRFLTPAQATRCVERLKLDSSIMDHDKITVRQVLSVFVDPRIVLVWTASLASGVIIFGLAYFTPSIVRGMGYSPIRTQLMSVPPFAVAVVTTLCTAYLSDKYNARGFAMIVTYFLSLVGSIIFYVGRSVPVRYTGLFILLGGVYANVPCLVAWIPNNTAGHSRRATAIAMTCIVNNVGGIISTWIYPTKDAPYYLPAARAMLSLTVVGIVSTSLAMWLYARGNKQKADPTIREKRLRGLEGLSFDQQLSKLGDSHPDYKYML